MEASSLSDVLLCRDNIFVAILFASYLLSLISKDGKIAKDSEFPEEDSLLSSVFRISGFSM